MNKTDQKELTVLGVNVISAATSAMNEFLVDDLPREESQRYLYQFSDDLISYAGAIKDVARRLNSELHAMKNEPDVIRIQEIKEGMIYQRFCSDALTSILDRWRKGALVEAGETEYFIHEPTPERPFEIFSALHKDALSKS